MLLKADFGQDRAAALGLAPGYAKLFGLAIRHGYCNASGGFYGGIAVSPSPVTAARLPRHGLLPRARSNGIDLLWNGIRGSDSGWSEPLLFVMSLTDGRFFNVTDLPTDSCSGRPILRYSNSSAAAGETSASAQVLLAQPQATNAEGSAEVEPPRSSWLGTRGETAAAIDEREWFRSCPPAPPFGLVEIVLPEDGRPAEYEIGFEARPTWWRYLIGSRGGDLDFDSFAIEGKGDVRFERAGTRTLPDGRPSAVFEASGTLLLQQRSPERLALRGISGGARTPRVLVDPLPTPSADAIVREAQRVWSEIYVFV